MFAVDTLTKGYNQCRIFIFVNSIDIRTFFNEHLRRIHISYIITKKIILFLVIGQNFTCYVNKYIDRSAAIAQINPFPISEMFQKNYSNSLGGLPDHICFGWKFSFQFCIFLETPLTIALHKIF